jgi:membrane protein DedA with SNARE-associated domain
MFDLPQWLHHAPLAVLLAALVVAGLGVPIPEDVVLLTAGALAQGSSWDLVGVTLLCAGGVLAGDSLLFLNARRLGREGTNGWLGRLLPEARRQRLTALFARRGAAVVFVARHVAGLRAPVFALAGINGMPLRTFLFWDALGACVSVPVMVLLGHAFADHLDRVRAGAAHIEHWLLAAAGLALAVYGLVSWLRGFASGGARR